MQTGDSGEVGGDGRFLRQLDVAVGAALAATLFLSGAALAGVVEAPTETEATSERRRQLERAQEQRTQLEPEPTLEPTPTIDVKARLPNDEVPCSRVRKITFHGLDPDGSRSELGPLDKLATQLSGPAFDDSPLNRCLGPNAIAIILQRAKAALVAQGYVTSQVLAPTQDLSDGELKLSVMAGRIHAIHLKSNTGVALRNVLPLDAGDVVNSNALDQALENLTRVPSVTASIEIDAAREAGPNQSDITIQHFQRQPARFTTTLDDSGSKGTGRLQASATLSLDNPLGWSDLFYFTLNHDLNAELGNALGGTLPGDRGTRGYSIHYGVPLGYWNVSANHTSGRFHYQIFGRNFPYTYSGTNEANDIALSRVMHRDSVRKTTLSLKIWQRESHNFKVDLEVLNQRRSVGGFELGLAHKTTVHTSRVDASVAYKLGSTRFASLPADKIFFHGDNPAFYRLNLHLNATTPFALGQHPSQHSVQLRAQQNGTALPPQDFFAIGSRHSVRGFDGESSLSAERGWTLHSEVSTAVGHSAQNAYLGIDTGEVGGPNSAYLLGTRLSGLVLGLRGQLRKLQYDIFVGAPLDQPKHFKTAHTSAGFSLTLSL